MTQDTALANAKLVRATEVVTSHVVPRRGRIAEIGTGASISNGPQDCSSDFLTPGLIERPTDNLERHPPPFKRARATWTRRAGPGPRACRGRDHNGEQCHARGFKSQEQGALSEIWPRAGL